MFFRVVQSAWLIIPNIEVATVGVLKEKGVLRNLQENTCARVSFLTQLQAKNNFSYRTTTVAASVTQKNPGKPKAY